MKTLLEKIFKLKANKTNIKTEIIAGVTTFFTMAYIIFLCPSILSLTGMDFDSVFVATVVAAIMGCLVMGLYANVPYALAPGLGLASLFTYTVCFTLGFTWEQSLAMVFICGVINLIITVTKVRTMLIKAIPEFMQHAIEVGIGLFIAYVGVKHAGLIQFSVDNISRDGIALANDVIPHIVSFNAPNLILAVMGLAITSVLMVKKVPGNILLGILITTIIGIPLGVTPLPDFSNGIFIPSMAPTFMKLDFNGLFTAGSIIVVIMTIFTFSLSDIFDTLGTFIGTSEKAGIFKDKKDTQEISPKLKKALIADSIGTLFGSLLGTSNTTTYVESAVGIEHGGRTGLTAVSVAICFFLALFFAPIIKIVPAAATAPILILIGISLIDSVKKINWEDAVIAIPAFLTIIFMPFSMSITTGIEFGFIFYILTKLALKEGKSVHPIMYIFTFLFLLEFVYKAAM